MGLCCWKQTGGSERGYSRVACLGFSPGWLLWLQSAASRVHGPQRSRPVGSSAGAVARVVELRRGVCDLPGVPCVARQTLNHWITGEAVLGFLSSRW